MKTIAESDDKQENNRESSSSIGSRIDDFEETLERKLRLDSGTSRFMRCVGGLLKIIITWYVWLTNKEHED